MKTAWVIALTAIIISQFASAQIEDEFGLIEIAQSPRRWSGIAVTQDENDIIVCYPRWGKNTPVSVARLNERNIALPFPDRRWNEWRVGLSPRNHFVSVQSIKLDDEGFLWILDSGNPRFQGVLTGGAKLIKVDVEKKRVIKKYYFNKKIVPKESYLADFIIDSYNNFAFITDSKLGGIIILNLKTGSAARKLTEHRSTQPQIKNFRVENIEWPSEAANAGGASCSITMIPGGTYIYYKPTLSRELYRVPAILLWGKIVTDQNIANKIEIYTPSNEYNNYKRWMFYDDVFADPEIEPANVGTTDGFAVWYDNSILMTTLEYDAIRHTTRKGRAVTVIRDLRLSWPDSMCVLPSGTIYFTTSQSHLDLDEEKPFKLWKFVP